MIYVFVMGIVILSLSYVPLMMLIAYVVIIPQDYLDSV